MDIEQILVDFLVEHSPPDSGPVYLALAKHWDTVQMALTAFFGIVFIVSIWFAIASLTSFDD